MIPPLVICSAVVDNTTLMELYHIATREPYSLLYVKRMVVGSNYLLFKHFDKRLTVQYVFTWFEYAPRCFALFGDDNHAH